MNHYKYQEKKYLFLVLIILLLGVKNSYSQSKSLSKFDTNTCSFSGSKLEQAEYLLRLVHPMGRIEKENREIPKFLTSLLENSTPLVLEDELSKYIISKKLSENAIGGKVSSPISKNKRNINAKYFVIHDVSTPNYMFKPFPANINDETWTYNDVEKNWNLKKAHIFIGRTGKSHSPVFFNEPWRATKFELKIVDKQISKGLFVHVELVQPRKSQKGKWENNDIIAPTPGFTLKQYDRLALIYIIASFRSGKWMVPVFHSVLDEGLKNAHDDPQNFDLLEFNNSLEKVYAEITNKNDNKVDISNSKNLWATYYYLPVLKHNEKGIDLLDENGDKTNFKLSLCDWCNANIQGTVMIVEDNQKHLLNYAGRSTYLQNDCRKCDEYKNYDGYNKTGKVLWMKSTGFGLGVKGYKLVPFRTIAVDSSVIPYGSVIHIPEAEGVEYVLDGQTLHHDGYFFAGDTGSKIIGNHIDVFIGINTSNPFDFIKSNRSKTFEARIITDQIKIEQLRKLHE